MIICVMIKEKKNELNNLPHPVPLCMKNNKLNKTPF